MYRRRELQFGALMFLAAVPTGASANPWRDLDNPAPVAAVAVEERWLRLDEKALRAALAASASPADGRFSISLPTPQGGYARFLIERNEVMAPGLAARYPEIQTFSGVGIDDRLDKLRLELTPAGVSAMVFGAEGVSLLRAEPKYGAYRVFQRETVIERSQMQCGVVPGRGTSAPKFSLAAGTVDKTVGPGLRRYRTAIAATGEYTSFFGGTKAGALAGIVAAVNRVNQVFEREVGVTLQLISDNDAVIYTNAATDPYTNDDGNAMLDENTANLAAVIGNANFDFGHVFSTGGGGVAVFDGPCNNANKAQGVTGSSVPDQDAFWIDYVAHEMGHQMSAAHTFNDSATGACAGNRDADSAVEPGSGSTILSYAGICGAQGAFSLQNNSDPYYHVVSLAQMHDDTQNAGATCGTLIATGNSAPNITQTLPTGAGGNAPDALIPARTPFFLDALATDAEGDSLTYAWEEIDVGTASPPMDDDGSRPIIRSFSPSTSSVRVVPNLNALLGGATTFGEALPTTSRNLRFRLTVRDNRSGGGGVHWSGETGQASDVLLQVVNTGSPFRVTSQNTTVALNAGSSIAVTWEQAGTALAPISCAQAVIGWSSDGGRSFSPGLETTVANSGTAIISVPGLQGAQTRIRVRCASSPFFDVNDANLSIEGSVPGTRIFASGFES